MPAECRGEMLLDRVPGGGWNAGNGVVYGVPVAPHPDDTAIALLALSDRRQDPVVQIGVQYLESVAPTLTAPWSLAWAILALAAYGRPIASLYRSLVVLPNSMSMTRAPWHWSALRLTTSVPYRRLE